MTPPSSSRASTVRQRRWRYQTRLRLLRLYGFRCAFGPDECSGPLQFAHRYPALRPLGPDGFSLRRSMDEMLREVRAHPFLFVVACSTHHAALDAPLRAGGRTDAP